jgi:hypothetical protein
MPAPRICLLTKEYGRFEPLQEMSGYREGREKRSLLVRLRSKIGGITSRSKNERGKEAAVIGAGEDQFSNRTSSSKKNGGKLSIPLPRTARGDQIEARQTASSPSYIVRGENEPPTQAVVSTASCSRCGRDKVLKPDDLHAQGASEPFTCSSCLSPLICIPLELFQQVTSYLDNTSLWLLRLTCSRIYAVTPTTPNPKHQDHAVEFMTLIRDFIPLRLDYCRECNTYHRWTNDIFYWWSAYEKCCRRYAGADGIPSFRGGVLGRGYYVCGACNTRRLYNHCALCKRCETCCEEKRVYLNRLDFYCEACNVKKIRCCGRPILARRACHGCQRCEKCSGCKFGSGQTMCGLCHGHSWT